MNKIKLDHMEKYLLDLFVKTGLNIENARIAVDVYMRATLRGVGHHDIYDISSRIESLKSGKVVPNPVFTPIASYGALETWDAGNGLGEVVCTYAMDRAMALANLYGIGFCSLRNTNHFLASAPYVERAAEKGYIAVILCKAIATMGGPGVKKVCMSQLPMGFAYPTDEGYPVMLDICMAYASSGLLRHKAKHGELVPSWWGYNASGEPTEDPAELADGIRMPIGGHKGFGLAMFGEILTGVIGMGGILNNVPEGSSNNVNAHTAIAIKPDTLMDADTFKSRAGQLSRNAKAIAPELRIPGENSHRSKETLTSNGYIELDDALVNILNSYADEYNINRIV